MEYEQIFGSETFNKKIDKCLAMAYDNTTDNTVDNKEFYFSSKENAQKAIDIPGVDVIRTALNRYEDTTQRP